MISAVFVIIIVVVILKVIDYNDYLNRKEKELDERGA